MKRIAVTSFLFCLILNVQGQIFKVDKHGEELYVLGTKYIELGEYKRADSILSLALCTYKNENVYYNRGISKLFIQDTIGFCSDMNIAANKYLDMGAEKYFNNFCCKQIDTFYYDKNMKASSKQLCRFYEVYKELKYENERMGKFHDVKAKNLIPSFDYGCDQNLISLNAKPTDIIGMYEYIDSIKFYYFSEKTPAIKNQIKYEDIKKRISLLLINKYRTLKEINKIDKVTVGYTIHFSKNGDIVSVKYAGTFPEIDFGDRKKEIEADIEKSVKYYPKITPAKFMKENVNFIVYDFVEF